MDNGKKIFLLILIQILLLIIIPIICVVFFQVNSLIKNPFIEFLFNSSGILGFISSYYLYNIFENTIIPLSISVIVKYFIIILLSFLILYRNVKYIKVLIFLTIAIALTSCVIGNIIMFLAGQ